MFSFTAETMRCGGCANAIRRAIAAVAPTAKVSVDIARKQVDVSGADDERVLLEAVASAGHRLMPMR